MRIDERADLSIEICHLYGDELDVEHLTEGIGAAAPIVELVRSRRPDWSISVCVLVDDYFGSVQQSSDEIRSMIEEASGITSLSVDHVVSEAGLAESVGFLLNRLLPRPSAGAGSKEKGADADRFVSNNQGAIDAEGDTEGPLFVEWAERVPGETSQRTSIGFESPGSARASRVGPYGRTMELGSRPSNIYDLLVLTAGCMVAIGSPGLPDGRQRNALVSRRIDLAWKGAIDGPKDTFRPRQFLPRDRARCPDYSWRFRRGLPVGAVGR